MITLLIGFTPLCTETLHVKWLGQMLDPFTSFVGLPQGAILSPALYTFYKHGIFEAFVPRVKSVIYADDTFIYNSGYSLQWGSNTNFVFIYLLTITFSMNSCCLYF